MNYRWSLSHNSRQTGGGIVLEVEIKSIGDARKKKSLTNIFHVYVLLNLLKLANNKNNCGLLKGLFAIFLIFTVDSAESGDT